MPVSESWQPWQPDCERLAADDEEPLAVWFRREVKAIVARRLADHSEREPA